MKKSLFKKSKYFILILCLVISFVTFYGISEKTQRQDVQVHIIDVGQGDSSLIITPDRKTILVDAGEEEFSRNVVGTLRKNRIRKIDCLIATHFDSDHIGAMDKIIDRFRIEKFLCPANPSDRPEFLEVIDSCERSGLRITSVKAGDGMDIGKFTHITVLSPSKIDREDENSNSIVFFMNSLKYGFVFTGDAPSAIEKEILENFDLPGCDFLKVGHHGSKTSSCEEFISEIRPRISTISCGYKNRFSHPHRETLDTLRKYRSKVYRTDINGNMTFYFGEDGISAKERYKQL